MLANGAPTSRESWTGASHIHDTLITIGAWFIEGIAGIRSDGKSPGFEHFIVKPAVLGDLTFARARYHSVHGDIISEWRLEKGAFRLNVTVPPGTTATVFVPGKSGVEVVAGEHSFETPL
jgi:alpha-L-rhamnosidase